MASQKIIKIILPLIFAAAGCASSNVADVKFRYDMMLQKTFGELGEGRPLPVTIEKATEIDGAVTGNGQFLFFASDRDRGNFDIYLRSLSDITTVRLTGHPSKDFSPAVSPDGKYLAFVSLREDPQGDLYVMKVDPAKMIEDAARGESAGYDEDTDNITAQTDALSRAPLSIKDSDPAWSPDGSLIAFSSTRSGTEEIYVCTRKGKDIRKISTKGGLYPSFSRDGSKIIFVSYRDNPQGDIYSADTVSGSESRLTSSAGLKLYPSYGAVSEEFFYTLIDKDTSGDGVIDFADRSVLISENSVSKKNYPLTLYGSSSFRGRWFPVFPLKYANSQEYNFQGVIFYSEQVGDNININLIPEYGIIPKRKSAVDQYDFAETLQTEESDREKYILALMRVYNFYGSKTDNESVIAVTRALLRAASEYRDGGNAAQADTLVKTAISLSRKNDDYPYLAASAYAKIIAGKDASSAYESGIAQMNAKNASLVYLLDDAAAYYLMKGNAEKAVAYYSRITKDFPSYKRVSYAYAALAQLTFNSMKNEISPYYIEVMRKGKPFQKDKASLDLVRFFRKETDPRKRIQMVQNIYPLFEQADPSGAASKSTKADSNILGLLDFVAGLSYAETGNIRSAEENLAKALSRLKTTEILYYDVNLQLADIAARQGDGVKEEKYLASAANSYLNRWNRADYTAVLARLIDYYENKGAESEYAGEYKKASELYSKYVKLVTYLHWLKKYEGIYNEYGARAHVLYIDAYANTGPDMVPLCKELETQYTGDKLDIARMNLDKAHIYGLSYIYAKTGVEYGRLVKGLRLDITERSVIDMLQKSRTQIDWALFMDDTFSDPYLLQGWLNQFIDIRRNELTAAEKGMDVSKYNDAFPQYLWEKNKTVYQKAIDVNDEARFPDKEGSLHLNLANTHFLLMNYPAALEEYRLAAKYKKNFGSSKEEAFFRYHLGYCSWQNGEIAQARIEMKRVLEIYRSMSGSGAHNRYAEQMMIVYRFLALFDRTEKNYESALSWYASLLDEGHRSKVAADDQRTWLDMAYCYEQLGDDDRAIAYCKRADGFLQKADNDDPTFKMQFRLFGLFAFQLVDLGPDAVVIGDSRCFSGLTVVQKRYLALSALERIAIRRGEYPLAQEYIAQKIALAKKGKNAADVEVHIRALNNAGYCSFMMMKYNDARSGFDEALAVATKAQNLKGVFASIMNLVDLYSYAAENNLPLLSKKEKDLDELKGKITSFRNDYEKVRNEKEKKDIESAAKEKNVAVKQSDIEDARKKTAADAAVLYADLDIAAATIDFYRAEYISGSMKPGADGYAVYTQQDELFRIYKDAGIVFETAVDNRAGIMPRMKAKLWMNAAACRTRTGFQEKAYELLGRAERIAVDTARDDILWDVYYREALLMRDAGRTLDDDAQRIAERFFESSCSTVEKHPAFLAQYAGRIGGMYGSYARMLVRKNDASKALRIMERRYAVQRVISVSLAAPDFSESKTQGMYGAYLSSASKLSSAIKTRSSLLDAGTAAEDPLMIKAAGAVKKAEAELSRINENITLADPLLSSQLFVTTAQTNDAGLPKNTSVSVFLADDETVYGWKMTAGKTETAKFSGDAAAVQKSAAAFIKGSSAAEQRFVVLNDIAITLFMQTRTDMPACMFVPSVERVRYYSGNPGIAGIGSVYRIPAGKADLAAQNLALYDVIVDAEGFNLDKMLFKRSVRPSLVIAPLAGARSAADLMEAMLWSGGSVIFMNGDIPVSTRSDLLQWKGNLSDLNVSGKGCFASGKDARITDDAAALSALKTEYEQKLNAAVTAGNAEDAQYYFYRMKDLSSGIETPAAAYLFARILELSGRDDAALEQAHAAASGGKAEYVSYEIYLMLKTGKIAQAGVLSSSVADKDISGSADMALYKAILSRIHTGTLSEIPLPQGRFLVPADKLILLLQRYVLLADSPVPASSGMFTELSPADMLISVYCGGKSLHQETRARDIAALFGSADQQGVPGRALMLAETTSGYDAFSVYPVLAALNILDTASAQEKLSFVQSFDPVALSAKAGKIDRLIFLSHFADMALSAGAGEKFISAADFIIRDTQEGSVSWLHSRMVLKKVRYLASVSRYEEAQALLNKTAPEELHNAGLDTASLLLRAECAIFRGDTKNGTALLTKGNFRTAGETVTRDLLFAHAERIQIIAKPAYAPQGFPAYEKYMKEAVQKVNAPLIADADAPRRDLLDGGIDFLISFNMKKGDNVSALLYAELRNQIAYWRAFPSAVSTVSAEAADSYKTASVSKEPLRYADAVSRYPELARAERIPFLPLSVFQKKIPSGSCVLYVIRNERDLFAWIIDREYLQPVRIPGGYDESQRLISMYADAVKNLSPVNTISEGLNTLLSPLLKQTGGKKLYIITDGFTEKIPFEITGAGQVLSAKTQLLYLPSIMGAFGTYPEMERTCAVIGTSALDETAIRESGIVRGDKPGGIVHIVPAVAIIRGGISIAGSGSDLQGQLKGKSLMWINGPLPIDSASLFSIKAASDTVGAVAVNAAELRDVNSPYFVSMFYSRMKSGESAGDAFSASMKSMSLHRKFSHPAFWAGIRLYTNGFQD